MERRFIIAYIITCSLLVCAGHTVLSQSPNVSIDDGQYHGWPLFIGGTVYDADRRPVSGVVVTLYQNGQIVNRSINGMFSTIYSEPMQNPVISQYYYSKDSGTQEGSYSFFGLTPGVYELVAEKGAYNASVTVDVNSSKASSHGRISLDIWLDGYHGPVWTQEQLSSPGAITGMIYDMNGTPVRFALVTLMQNGQAMNIPHNPRHSYFNGTYVFKYLLPGDYQVIVEKDGHKSVPMSVSVQNGTSYSEITMYDYDQDQPSTFGTPSLTPTPGPSAATTTPLPTPSAGISVALMSIVIAMAFAQKVNKRD